MSAAVFPEGGRLLTEVQGATSPHTISIEDFPNAVDAAGIDVATKILSIINNYRLQKSHTALEKAEEGALKFLAIIYSHVRAGQIVPMCLPAFPFKSPNTSTKCLGKLPDKAEELALDHLNGLCHAIQDVYPPGAKLIIVSDGLVYNDLLGVPDKDVWNYGESLRRIAKSKGFTRIEFSRLKDLVPISVPYDLDEMTYVANASNFRRALLDTFADPNWQWKEVSQIEDVCLTYRGYIKFLETDLADVYPVDEGRSKSRFKRGVEYIAKQMMCRGHAFSSAVRTRYKDCVRLSIHPSTGATKLSISLLPTTSSFTTPWHCTVAYNMDGTFLSGPKSEFSADKSYELVVNNGLPSYYRKKSDLFSWAVEGGDVSFEPMYPSGWMIRPAKGFGALSIRDIDAKRVRCLAELNSPVVMRGFFKSPKQDVFIKKSREFGRPLPWKYGLLLEVKDQGKETRGLNNVLSAEWMPFHFDGLFKTVTTVNDKGEETRVPDPPRYEEPLCFFVRINATGDMGPLTDERTVRFQLFAGAASSPNDTGFTLFSSSTMLLRYLPEWLTVRGLSGKTWTVSTSSFGSPELKSLPLIISHPTTGKPCLRYHEPWPQSKTKFDATHVSIDDENEEVSHAICETLDSALHDRRVAYHHAWEKGDLVVSDNILMLHTRSGFEAGSSRELWRVHFD